MVTAKQELTPQDLQWLAKRGIHADQIYDHIKKFEIGTMTIALSKPATINDGILRFDDSQLKDYIRDYEKATATKKFLKFVPASGAATRMFKTLITFASLTNPIPLEEITQKALNGSVDHQFLIDFLRGLENYSFAFCQDLQRALLNQGIELSLTALFQQGHYREILTTLLTENGLNYNNLPKALIKFHDYGDHCRTALEEHLVEGQHYAKNNAGDIYLHFTVPPQFEDAIRNYLNTVLPRYQKNDEHFYIDYSIQHPSTDTVAVDENNQICRDEFGYPILRPGGHGALIKNLNALDADIIFIKNIDNIVPDHLKPETICYKKVLAGYLLNIQTRVFSYLHELTEKTVTPQQIKEITQYAQQTLNITFPHTDITVMSYQEQVEYLFKKLNRPIRVCGMVKNEGEPGGGPFWVHHEDNTSSLQIIEDAQINKNLETHRLAVKQATHFNPVDLVCGIKDFNGKKFNLEQFTDPNMYFISEKSKDGHTIKALELPGLWNGAMANWITIFVEVPLITFNPIKTVNDLLRDTHH